MTAVIYLFNRFFYRIFEFLEHWYIGSFKVYSHFFISFLEKLDRTFAFKITLRNLFQPLYSDRSFIGYILGFFFRSGRLFISGILYLIIIVLAIFIYLAWLLVPIYIIYKILFSIPQ